MSSSTTSKQRKVTIIAVVVVVVVIAATVVAVSIGTRSQNSKNASSGNNNIFDISNDEEMEDPSNDVAVTKAPTILPSNLPSMSPSMNPTATPSLLPSLKPSYIPTLQPSQSPSVATLAPSTSPSKGPSRTPTTPKPTAQPTPRPTPRPTPIPTPRPTPMPTPRPTARPTISPQPTQQPATVEPSLSEAPTDSLTATTTRFYAIGDVPYTAREAEELEEQIRALPDDAEFLIHVGDIRSARDGVRCMAEDYVAIANILLLSHAPVFLVMGDNEWNDCPNVNQGYNHWITVLGKFDENWNHNIDVIRPTDRPENFAFVHKQALYIGLNIVGGSVHHRGEWNTRFQDQMNWVKELVDSYAASETFRGIKSVILIGHADPTGDHAAFFDPLVDYIQDVRNNSNQNDNEFAFLYLNGDSHVWKYQPDFLGVSHFLRMQVEGGTRDPPVAITVSTTNIHENADTISPLDIFSFDRRLEEL